MRTLNFAVVGCGRIAKRHTELLGNEQVAGARLCAVCDIRPEAAQKYAQLYQIPYFTDFHTMMRECDVDVVVVLTPSGDHADHVIQLSRYQKDIMVEKPMALTLKDADAMIQACVENSCRLFVVKQNRFNVPVMKLREAIEQKRLGSLFLGTVRVRWCRTQEYYDQDSWRGTWAMDGGVLTNQASHHIDLLEWMMGDVISVMGKSITAGVDIEVEDTAVVVLQFSSGALGIIEATTAVRPTDLEGSISIMGQEGTVEIGGFAVNHMKTWNFTQHQDDDDKVLEQFSENPPNVYGYGHQAYYDHVVDCICNNKKQLVDGFEGRKSLELINAIYESIETGKEIPLQFSPRFCKLGQKHDCR